VVALLIFATVAGVLLTRGAENALNERVLAQVTLAASALDGQTGRLDHDFPKLPIAGSAVAVYRRGTLVQVIGDRPPADILRAGATVAAGSAVVLSGSRPYRIAVDEKTDAPGVRVAAFASDLPIREEADRLRRSFTMLGVPLVVLSIIAAWFLARRSLAPIDRLTRTAADVANTGRFSQRFDIRSRDEVGRLGSTFNSMLESLEATYERERAFIGDVSHELRQPLTAIAGEAQLALKNPTDAQATSIALQRIDERATALGALTDDLLLLARADAHALGTGNAEVSDALAEACNTVRSLHPGVTLSVQLREEPMNVRIAGPLLVRLIANILRNAMQFARTQVLVSARREAASAVILIDDDGPGIPPEAREEVFRRFQRLATERSGPGTGLGLAIASAIASAAGGGITIEAAPQGGARFIVRLPVRA
jgi:signal transduction histidine kinase